MVVQLLEPIAFVSQGIPFEGIRSVTLLQTRDNPTDRTVVADTNFGPLILWEGVAYDVAGDYTQQQVYNKLRYLLEHNPQFQ